MKRNKLPKNARFFSNDNEKHGTSTANEEGFVGVIFLAVALITIVVGALATMNRSQSTSTATDSARVTASRIMKHSVDFKNAWDQKLLDEGNSYNLRNYYIYAGAPAFLIPPGATTGMTMGFFNQQLNFNLSERVNLPGIGGNPGALPGDIVLSLPKLTRAVCVAINNLLYKDAESLEPGSSNSSSSVWEDPNAQVTDQGVASARYTGRNEGCVKTTDGTYVYFKAILER